MAREINNDDDPIERMLRELEEELDAARPAEDEEPQEQQDAPKAPPPTPDLPDPDQIEWEPKAIVEAAVEMATAKTTMLEQAVSEIRREFPEIDDEELANIVQSMQKMRPQELKSFCENNGHRGLAYTVLGVKVKRTGAVPGARRSDTVTPVGPESPEDAGFGLIAEIEKYYGKLPPEQMKRLKKELGL